MKWLAIMQNGFNCCVDDVICATCVRARRRDNQTWLPARSVLSALPYSESQRTRSICAAKTWQLFLTLLIAYITDYSVARPRRSHHACMTGSYLDSALPAYKTGMNQVMLLPLLYLMTK
jgi:hypothetical protein